MNKDTMDVSWYEFAFVTHLITAFDISKPRDTIPTAIDRGTDFFKNTSKSDIVKAANKEIHFT